MKKQLTELRALAQAKIATGQEPPWAWFQYMKLIEVADAILGGQACVTTMESSRQSESHPETHRPPPAAMCSPNIVQLRPDSLRPQMPM
jgi:hypothetical protein